MFFDAFFTLIFEISLRRISSYFSNCKASTNPSFYPKTLDLRAAGVELSDDDMFDSDDEAPQAGPILEDDPEGVDFIDSDDESNMLGNNQLMNSAQRKDLI